ncbi:MAG: dihydropteroate synthase [Promethearchaeota archaeon]
MSIHKVLFPKSAKIIISDIYTPIIQGIINLSPESFYKESYVSQKNFSSTIKDYIENGAKIIDVGARSTAPGVAPITKEEELSRLKRFLDESIEYIPKDIVISIDTQYSDIAKYCIEFCMKRSQPVMINDVSGLKTDPNMEKIIVDYDVPFILMASERSPGDLLSVNAILDNLFSSILHLEKLNYDLNKLIIDPGIGRWIPEKIYEYDLSIIDNLERFRVFCKPILVGISRKSFIGAVLNKSNPLERYNGTLAATAIAVYNGAHIIRTHDVNPQLVEIIKMAHAIRAKQLIYIEEQIKASLITFIKDPMEARIFQRLIGVTPAGSRIMAKKMVSRLILLENLTVPQALILKQEMLARGGDVAIHKEAITTENKKYVKNQKILLIGTEKQLESLIEKLRGQQLELDRIGYIIKQVLEKSSEDKLIHSIEE